MPKGKKTGGRTKGTPNKSGKPLKDLADQLGVDPFQILLHFAAGDYEALGYVRPDAFDDPNDLSKSVNITPEVRLKAASEAASYLYPKRKALEHTGEGGGPIAHTLESLVGGSMKEGK